MADLQLESPVAQPPVAPVPPATGQVNPQSFQAVSLTIQQELQ